MYQKYKWIYAEIINQTSQGIKWREDGKHNDKPNATYEKKK